MTKPLSEFYKHSQMKDGHVNKCKSCNKTDVQNNYKKNIDYYKEYDQIRNQKRKEYLRKKNKKYQKENPEIAVKAKKKWAENNKDKRAAQGFLSNAVRNGRVEKGVCQICKSKDTEAHHYDYTKPLSVIWLCDKHHKKVHWWLRFWRRKYKK